MLDGGFITPGMFSALQTLNNPYLSPWTQCAIEPPKRCAAPQFKQPAPSNCTVNDLVSFISSLPNAAICGPSIATYFSPPPNNSMALSRALRDVCTDNCGGAISNFYKNSCNDQFGAENIRINCISTNGTANSVGPYCRFAADVNISYFDDFPCMNYSSGNYCAPICRNALIRLKAEVGCCY